MVRRVARWVERLVIGTLVAVSAIGSIVQLVRVVRSVAGF